jgi:hypothetical protein
MDLSIAVPLITAVLGAMAALGAVYLTHYLGKRRISDKEQFRLWLTLFDRPAFKGPYRWKSDPKPFEEAINIVINAINTGDVRNRRGDQLTELCGKGKTQLRNPRLREQMDAVAERLRAIRGLIRAQIAGRATGPDLAAEVDSHRDWVITEMNRSWAKFGFRGLELPSQADSYEGMYEE